MSKVICDISVSLDGFAAGPEQSEQDPLGVGGMALHTWHIGDGPRDPVDERFSRMILDGVGAYVMGRNMFGPIRGEWSGDWRGWWGADPPYHDPVFVLTHHARESLEMEGGTTFHFVTEGFDVAFARAQEAAGPERNVSIAGGASTVNQALAAGVVDELRLHVSPIMLGSGERLFEGVGDVRMEILESVSTAAATHVRYSVTSRV